MNLEGSAAITRQNSRLRTSVSCRTQVSQDQSSLYYLRTPLKKFLQSKSSPCSSPKKSATDSYSEKFEEHIRHSLDELNKNVLFLIEHFANNGKKSNQPECDSTPCHPSNKTPKACGRRSILKSPGTVENCSHKTRRSVNFSSPLSQDICVHKCEHCPYLEKCGSRYMPAHFKRYHCSKPIEYRQIWIQNDEFLESQKKWKKLNKN